MTYELTPEDATVLRGLRKAGFAVCVFQPHEIGNSDPDQIEDAMAEAGWHQINFDNEEVAP